MFQKVAPKVATAVFLLETKVFQYAPKSQQNTLATFAWKIVAKNFKNRPI